MGYKSINPSPLFFSINSSDNSHVPYIMAKFSINPVSLFCKKRSSNFNNGMYSFVKKRWNYDSIMIEDNSLRVELSIYLRAKQLLLDFSSSSSLVLYDDDS